ncbi:hypothetical protein DPEC_G00210030 [Dallia pectoralis]|uniref:Uncharacterized protein n=1 Tax=Dallia pectoralis TaxID=75939 RepID=A0ACC2G5M9_DALPE|nr:hypothetical protein DPEC_G00210030 [Dallia pectoralis]
MELLAMTHLGLVIITGGHAEHNRDRGMRRNKGYLMKRMRWHLHIDCTCAPRQRRQAMYRQQMNGSGEWRASGQPRQSVCCRLSDNR